jgi:hemoglobin-like flavoprotein
MPRACPHSGERKTVDIHQSLKTILDSDTLFGEAFYKTFFERCPDAKQYFDGINMERQALVVTMALTLIEQHYTNGYSAVEQYLRHLGNRHKERHVPPPLYPQWRDAMLAVLEDFHGEDWGEALAGQWREAIDGVSDSMLFGYDEHVGI